MDTKSTNTGPIPPDISVVVTTFNRPRGLTRCLSSIPDGVEVIVADDGTFPIPDFPEHILYWRHDHDGPRPSTCRNEGAKLATRPKLLFLDDDVELHPLALAAHSIALSMYDVSYGLLPSEKWIPRTDDRTNFYIDEAEMLWRWGWSGNFAIRRSTFVSVGGFDERTFNGGLGFEDIDLSRRLHLSSARLHLNRLAMAHHPSPHTSENPSPMVLKNQRRYEEKWK